MIRVNVLYSLFEDAQKFTVSGDLTQAPGEGPEPCIKRIGQPGTAFLPSGGDGV